MSLGKYLFRYRSFLPIPLMIVLIIFFRGTVLTFIIGSIIIFFGLLLRLLVQQYTGDWTRGNKIEGDFLIREGPYNIVRHPFYLANFLIGLGFFIISNFYLFISIILYIFLFSAYYGLIIKEEESFLAGKFGNEYLDYKRSTPSIIPRSFLIKGVKRKGFRNSLKIESSTIITVFFIFLIFLGRYFWKVL